MAPAHVMMDACSEHGKERSLQPNFKKEVKAKSLGNGEEELRKPGKSLAVCLICD